MIFYIAILLLLGNSVLLIYSLFAASHPSQEIITQVSGALTLFLFWCSEYFSQSKCKANGIIDFLKFLTLKLEKRENNLQNNLEVTNETELNNLVLTQNVTEPDPRL